ncbi:MAG: hypothetical protein KDC95_13265 [Planctomycetes bacterium]|nr:hypothetical protein [Planctomycetota bacterium]
MKRVPERIEFDGRPTRLVARGLEDDRFHVSYDVEGGEATLEVRAGCLQGGGFWFEGADGKRHHVYACGTDTGMMLRIDGTTHVFKSAERDAGDGDDDLGDPTKIVAPMTGTLVRVLCKPGDAIDKDQDLAVLSAMKMEHKLPAIAPGRVASIECNEGSTVEAGTVLIRIEVDGDSEA